jgi:hypothetical protein
MGEGTAVERRRKFRGCGIPSEVLGRWVQTSGKMPRRAFFSTMCVCEEEIDCQREEKGRIITNVGNILPRSSWLSICLASIRKAFIEEIDVHFKVMT